MKGLANGAHTVHSRTPSSLVLTSPCNALPHAMLTDLKFALRQLARSSGFTAVAIFTLALGIGLSASSFSMANTFLLRDLPYPHASELMRFRGTSRQSQRSEEHTSELQSRQY